MERGTVKHTERGLDEIKNRRILHCCERFSFFHDTETCYHPNVKNETKLGHRLFMSNDSVRTYGSVPLLSLGVTRSYKLYSVDR